MRLAPLLAIGSAVALLVATLPVEAQNDRARTRITVQKRSYLDAGTTVKPGSTNHHLYAYPIASRYPTYGPGEGSIEGGRWPLPLMFELPGY